MCVKYLSHLVFNQNHRISFPYTTHFVFAIIYGIWRDRKTGEHLGQKWQYGYIDETGKECIPLKFEWAGDFHDGRAAYMKYDREFWIHFRYGYIDVSGDPVIPPNFSRADDFKDGYASVSWFDEDLNCYSAVIDIYGTYYDYETY